MCGSRIRQTGQARWECSRATWDPSKNPWRRRPARITFQSHQRRHTRHGMAWQPDSMARWSMNLRWAFDPQDLAGNGRAHIYQFTLYIIFLHATHNWLMMTHDRSRDAQREWVCKYVDCRKSPTKIRFCCYSLFCELINDDRQVHWSFMIRSSTSDWKWFSISYVFFRTHQ